MLSAEHTLHKYILLNIKMSSPRAKLIYGANTLDNVDMSAKSKNIFLILNKTYVVGTQKNRHKNNVYEDLCKQNAKIIRTGSYQAGT